MIIKSSEFITSVADAKMLLAHEFSEIAVAGKSNVGKSSFINFLTASGKLAKTSKTPGRTRLINYFLINDKKDQKTFFLVDLPGYGFASAPKDEKAKWENLIENYFMRSKCIKNVFVLIDIRHEPTLDDKQMLKYLYYYNISFTLIATKADKLSKNAVTKRKAEIAASLSLGLDNVFIVSSEKKTGKEEILDRIDQILDC